MSGSGFYPLFVLILWLQNPWFHNHDDSYLLQQKNKQFHDNNRIFSNAKIRECDRSLSGADCFGREVMICKPVKKRKKDSSAIRPEWSSAASLCWFWQERSCWCCRFPQEQGILPDRLRRCSPPHRQPVSQVWWYLIPTPIGACSDRSWYWPWFNWAVWA